MLVTVNEKMTDENTTNTDTRVGKQTQWSNTVQLWYWVIRVRRMDNFW